MIRKRVLIAILAVSATAGAAHADETAPVVVSAQVCDLMIHAAKTRYESTWVKTWNDSKLPVMRDAYKRFLDMLSPVEKDLIRAYAGGVGEFQTLSEVLYSKAYKASTQPHEGGEVPWVTVDAGTSGVEIKYHMGTKWNPSDVDRLFIPYKEFEAGDGVLRRELAARTAQELRIYGDKIPASADDYARGFQNIPASCFQGRTSLAASSDSDERLAIGVDSGAHGGGTPIDAAI